MFNSVCPLKASPTSLAANHPFHPNPTLLRMNPVPPSGHRTSPKGLSFLLPAFAAALASALVLAPRPASAVPVSGVQGAPADAELPAENGPVVVYLVRHAEKADDGTADPPLTVAGKIRVRILKTLLTDVDLTQVHTTDWRRTLDTAQPIAEAAGLEPSVYDPADLAGLASAIRAMPGKHFVAGHSNTTPQLVEALGGEPGEPIHDMEYDRLYIVTIPPGSAPLTTLLRFGEPYLGGSDFSLRGGGSVPSGPRGGIGNGN